METKHYITEKPATPEYVLSVLRDSHRQQCEYDPEVEPDIELTFNSTIDEWRTVCNLVGWRKLGQALNQVWGINCLNEEWRNVLEPANQKTVQGVCEFIAAHTSQPEIRPARLLGSSCTSSGAFLTIRSLLQEVGVDVEHLRPSTPLAPYTRRHADVFLVSISRLAPGKLPPVKIIETPVYNVALVTLLLGWLPIILGIMTKHYWLSIIGVFIVVISYATTWIATRCLLPSKVEFGGLQTFRDLVEIITD
jgi:hypothetical protein